jgi:hypothetical protein
MRYYTVHAPPEDAEPERYAFVKDGFSWPALLVPVLWILWHRLWLVLVYYVVFVLVVAWAGRLAGDTAAFVVGALGILLFALEANGFRRHSLESRGWTELGATSGQNLAEAETRFFAAGPEQPDARDRRAAMLRAASEPHSEEHTTDEPILGLFPEPER